MVPPRGRTPRLQIGKNICVSKRINRLFRIADKKQAIFFRRLRNLINSVKNLVLNRVGILKFIDHGDWKLLSQLTRQ